MSLEMLPLVTIAALAGIVHTLLGPDHYLPFIALSKSQSWSRKKTAWMTSLCGFGHIASSVIIGVLVLGLRVSLNSLHIINSARSDLAAWGLIAFGCVYFIWSLKRLYKEKSGSYDVTASGVMFWALFTVFIVGPCEPLFILMTHPLLTHNPLLIVLLVSIFSLATIATMLTVVLSASFGLKLSFRRQTMKFAPAIAGITIMSCGLVMKFLGV